MTDQPRALAEQRACTLAALNILAKWRTLLAGWQLGTRPKGDPESDAVRDQREALLLLRAELTALTQLLITTGVIRELDYLAALQQEAHQANLDMQARFPGVTAHEHGLTIDPTRAAEWMTAQGWKQ